MFQFIARPVLAEDRPAGEPAGDVEPKLGESISDQIAVRLEQRLGAYEEKLETANRVMLGAIDKEVERVQQDTRTAVEQRLKQLESLKFIRTSFVEDGVLGEVASSGLKPAASRYRRAIDSAKRHAVAAYEQAIKEYGRANELEKAKRLLEQFEVFKAGQKEVDAEIESVEGALGIGALQAGARAFGTHRTTKIRSVSEDLPFSRLTLITGGTEDSLYINVKKAGWVYIATTSGGGKPELVDKKHSEPWELVEGFYTAGRRQVRYNIYRKQLSRGVYELPRMDWNSPVVLMR
ncbi:MAG: hypothetical protein AAGI37_12395 [Planctomycetota bacterium]